MALRKDFEISLEYANTSIACSQEVVNIPAVITHGFLLNKAYVKITNVDGDKTKTSLRVGIFTEDQLHLVIEKPYFFIPSVEDDAPNFIKQGYEHLKTLPDFEGATDA